MYIINLRVHMLAFSGIAPVKITVSDLLMNKLEIGGFILYKQSELLIKGQN